MVEDNFNNRLPQCVAEDLHTPEFSKVLFLKTGKCTKYYNLKNTGNDICCTVWYRKIQYMYFS